MEEGSDGNGDAGGCVGAGVEWIGGVLDGGGELEDGVMIDSTLHAFWTWWNVLLMCVVVVCIVSILVDVVQFLHGK